MQGALFKFVFIVCMLSLFSTPSVEGATVPKSIGCYPINGTKVYNFDFNTTTIGDPGNNKAGKYFKNIFNWNGGGDYRALCNPVMGNGSEHQVYFRAQTDLPLGHTAGEESYYIANEYLEISTKVYIAGRLQENINVPFDNLSNLNFKDAENRPEDEVWATGSKGSLSLYIRKAFVGKINMNNTRVMSIYGTTLSGSFGSEPLSSVYLHGAVVVPQSCVINSDKPINIDFDTISTSAFDYAGKKAEGVNPKTRIVQIKCSNIDAQTMLTLRVQADNVVGNAIVSNNNDVGFVITDENNKELTPNNISSVIPFALDQSANSNVTIKAYPVSVTGKKPAAGVVTSLAYLRVDFS